MTSNTSSLFGGASTTPQSTSLFGANNSTATPLGSQPKLTLGGLSGAGTQGSQGSGLFGGQQAQAQQQQPAPSGGLFGGQQALAPAAPTGGLFGGQQASAPAASTGGLFGGQQAQAQQQQPAPSGGLFGGQQVQAQAQQNAQNSSLFGGQSQAQQQPPILGQTQGQNPSQSTQPAFFNSLLERGKKRPLTSVNQNTSFEEVPSLQLGLDDIRRKARELGSGGQKDTPNGKSTKA